MRIDFSKYHGTGNDFILIDNRKADYNLSKIHLELLMHRRFGIGSDGLMLLSNASGYDFRMTYYNSDGNEGTMCGNGGRCIVKFAYDLGIIKQKTNFISIDGPHDALIKESQLIQLQMTDVKGIRPIDKDFYLNTGSPHYVRFVENIENFEVTTVGRPIRHANNANVNFIELTNDYLFVRTFERGVEDETYSCGTGVVASCIISYLKNTENNNAIHIEKIDNTNEKKVTILVKTLGGDLSVCFNHIDDSFTNIWLTGPAVKVYEGWVEL